MNEFTFEAEWTGGAGAIDRSQNLSTAIAAAARVLADSVAQDAGGAELPASVSEHILSLRDAGEDLGRALESMAARIAFLQQRNVLISVAEEDESAERAAQAVAALRTAAEQARRLSALISNAREPLVDLALTEEAGTAVWERYE